MEVINPKNTTSSVHLRKDNQLLVVTHLTQLLSYLTGFGGLIVPLILWAINKDKVEEMDKHGKMIINFQFSMIVYAIICIPLILLIGLGILGLILIAIIGLVFPIINAIKASNNEEPNYPFTIRFL